MAGLLIVAAKAGNLDECRRVHAERAHTPNPLRAEDYICALNSAAERGHLGVCRWLHATAGGAIPDTHASDALLWAAARGHLGVCRWLCATFALTPADARACNNLALHVAAFKGHLGVCQWFHDTFGITIAEWEGFSIAGKLKPHVAAWIASLE